MEHNGTGSFELEMGLMKEECRAKSRLGILVAVTIFTPWRIIPKILCICVIVVCLR
jgi:hypothetical protein